MADRPLALASQLRPPALRPEVLPRARLLGVLRSAAAHRLVLLSADAGYGKTTLLAQFHAACGGTAIWYTLTERDADLAVFFRRLTEGVGQHFRSVRHTLERYMIEHPALHRDTAGAAEALVGALARAARRDYYIILDDAHLLKGSPFVPQFLTSVVDQMPPHFHMVLAARHEPPLPVPLWRARRQVLELRNTDLRFVREEVDELYRNRLKLSLSAQDTEVLMRNTEGWAAALRWIAERMRLGEDGGSSAEATLEELRRSPGGLSEFYEAELFRRLPEREQAFLLRIASLEWLDRDLAAIAWKAADRGQILRSLVRRNLLVSAAQRGGEPELRLHPLFREFLLERAQEELPAGERARLLESLGRQLLESDPAAGLEQWRLIPQPLLVSRWLADNGDRFLSEGRYGRLDSLLSSLPRAALEGDPHLRVLRAENRRILGDWSGALEDFRAVERISRASGEISLAADAALGAAKIYTARGDAGRSLRIGQSLLRLGKRLRPRVRARALQIVGGALFYLGRYRETEKSLRELLAFLVDHPEPELELAAEHNLALTYCAMGRFLEARELFERHLRRAEVRQSRRRPLHLANLALLQLECGEPERGRETVLEAESLVERGGNLLQRASVLLSRGEVELRLGNLASVTAVTDELVRHIADLAHKAIEVGTILLRARYEWMAGSSTRAQQLVAEGIRALRGERGSLWFDLRLLEAQLWIAQGRWGRASTLLRGLLRTAAPLELRHVEARAGLALAGALWQVEDRPGARRAMARALKLCAREQYEQIGLEAAERNVELFADAWARGVEGEWLSRLFARKPELFWSAVGRGFPTGQAPRPGAAQLLGDWGDERCLGLLRQWETQLHRGPLRQEASRARRALQRRLGLPEGQPAAAVAEARLMGPLDVRIRGERLPLRAFRTERTAELFAYLAFRGEAGESRERLIHLFWPRASASEARRNLSPTLSYLIAAIHSVAAEVEVLEREDHRVRLAPRLGLVTDLETARRFERLRGESEAERAELERAALQFLEVRRGEFLEGWDSEWILEERRRFSMLQRRALLVTASAERRAQHYDDAERWVSEALRRDPLDEAAHRELLEILAQRGDFGRLWAEHRVFLEKLRRDAAGAPEPSTLQLVARLRAVHRNSAN